MGAIIEMKQINAVGQPVETMEESVTKKDVVWKHVGVTVYVVLLYT